MNAAKNTLRIPAAFQELDDHRQRQISGGQDMDQIGVMQVGRSSGLARSVPGAVTTAGYRRGTNEQDMDHI